MKIKNKLRYIIIFSIVLALLVSFSINVFAVPNGYINSGVTVTYSDSDYTLYVHADSFTYNNTTYYTNYSFSCSFSSSKMYIIGETGGSVVSVNIGDNVYFYSDTNINNVELYNDVSEESEYYSINNLEYCIFSAYSHKYYIGMNIVQPAQPLTKTYDVGSFYNNNTLYNQIIVDGVSEDSSSFSDITSITYKNSSENYQAVAYSNSSWTSGYNSNLRYFWNATVPTVSSINSDLNSIITFSTSVLSTDLDKSYNLDFLQNGSSYTNIRVIGSTINGTSFNSIHSIEFNSDQVYFNNNFVSGYSNYLGYTYTPPDSTVLSNLNSDLGGLLVFYTVQVNPTPEEKFFHDIDVSTNGILTIVYAFANNLLSNILLITMCIALPLVSFAVVQVIRIFKIKKGQ